MQQEIFFIPEMLLTKEKGHASIYVQLTHLRNNSYNESDTLNCWRQEIAIVPYWYKWKGKQFSLDFLKYVFISVQYPLGMMLKSLDQVCMYIIQCDFLCVISCVLMSVHLWPLYLKNYLSKRVVIGRWREQKGCRLGVSKEGKEEISIKFKTWWYVRLSVRIQILVFC